MDKIFTFSGLKKEFQRIRWPRWFKRETKNDNTVFNTSLKVLLFVGFFAGFFILCDLIAGLLLRAGA